MYEKDYQVAKAYYADMRRRAAAHRQRRSVIEQNRQAAAPRFRLVTLFKNLRARLGGMRRREPALTYRPRRAD